MRFAWVKPPVRGRILQIWECSPTFVIYIYIYRVSILTGYDINQNRFVASISIWLHLHSQSCVVVFLLRQKDWSCIDIWPFDSVNFAALRSCWLIPIDPRGQCLRVNRQQIAYNEKQWFPHKAPCWAMILLVTFNQKTINTTVLVGGTMLNHRIDSKNSSAIHFYSIEKGHRSFSLGRIHGLFRGCK